MLAGRIGARVRWCVTDREGGRSAAPYDGLNLALHVGDDAGTVRSNRREAALAFGVDPGRLVQMAPVHGRAVAVVDGPREQAVADVDALVTTVPALALAAMAADCVPVVLADPVAGVVGVAHAGWRGVRDDVVGEAVAAMLALGARTGSLRVLLGPAVCGACYPVPPERVEQVAAVVPAAAARARDGSAALDLRAGLAARLAALGITATTVGGCTVEDPSLFSHRRDGVTGRFAAMVVLEPPAAAPPAVAPGDGTLGA